ncbi:polysaccharide deacetylase family protein [Jidongwangia harbinensis]|uniref:polysaccharide deacetylase family protein n=1 Tax=Jidongwangia harbinensis TaxID=2878561 RepID=UPI001CD933CB|nr:polysaccharide deacetylase family protein [Jidongwangia harbinensis]MCA2214315.1 polysaccharide deacetylase family protein [Jidongwangia harbinensis]
MPLSFPSLTAMRRSAVALIAVVASATAIPAPASAEPPTPTIVDTARGAGNVVSFTFDDGPNPPDTLRLLQVLRRHQVRAVFCLWGDHVRQYPEVVRRIAADGHVLCNHSMRHDDLTTKTAEEIRTDLLDTNAAIREAVPYASIPYFRAPYGAWGESPQIAAELRMQPLGWRMDIADWEPPGANALVQRLRDRITPGAVVLMHDGGGDRSQTVQAVNRIIPELRGQQYRFTLPERRG